jgi:hypothetical protein
MTVIIGMDPHKRSAGRPHRVLIRRDARVTPTDKERARSPVSETIMLGRTGRASGRRPACLDDRRGEVWQPS